MHRNKVIILIHLLVFFEDIYSINDSSPASRQQYHKIKHQNETTQYKTNSSSRADIYNVNVQNGPAAHKVDKVVW
jgi:archaellum component FlaF (FlaF/FlaG flagellin family)